MSHADDHWVSLFADRFHQTDGNRDRGVTLVEYALIIGTVVVGSMSSVGALDTSIGTHYASTADDIGQPDLSVFDVTTTTSGTAGGSTSTTTTVAPTTTASATTSTAAATTTAAPTTTTTAAPTTTAAVTTTTSGALFAHSATTTKCKNKTYKRHKKENAKIVMEFDDEHGDDLEDAEVEVEFKLKDGTTGRAKGETNAWGRVAFEWDDLDTKDFDIEVTIIKIEKDHEEYEHSTDVCKLHD